MDEKLVRDKLKQIRSTRGWTEDQVSQKLGREGNSFVHRIENGPTKITLGVLNEFCALYGVQLSDLLSEVRKTGGEPRKSIFEKGLLRGKGSLTEELKAKVRKILPYARRIGSVLEYLGEASITLESIGVPAAANPPTTDSAASELGRLTAKALRKKFDIGEGARLDIVDFVWSELKIPICDLDLGTDCWGLYLADHFSNPLILFSSKGTFSQRAVFTIAHELGHHLLGREEMWVDCEEESSDLKETVANSFAQELLVPADSLRRHFDDLGFSLVEKILPRHIVQLCEQFKVSFVMMARCLRDLKKIDQVEYQKLRIYAENELARESLELGYKPETFLAKPKSLDDMLKETIGRALRNKVLPPLEAAKMLDRTTSELKELI